MKSSISKQFIIAAFLQFFFAATLFSQKYENGTRLLKGAEVMSATPLQLDYVLEKLADTAKIKVNLHEGKTHLVLDDGSGTWREWWYCKGRWKVKTQDNAIPQVNADWNATGGVAEILNKPDIPAAFHLPAATTSTVGGIKVGDGLSVTEDGRLRSEANDVTYGSFTPTVTGASGRVTFNLSDYSYGKYILNNRMVYIEMYVLIESISGTEPAGSIRIYIPPELRPSKSADITFSPIINILQHEKILKGNYTMIGGHINILSGEIELVLYAGSYLLGVSELQAGSAILFSLNYILP